MAGKVSESVVILARKGDQTAQAEIIALTQSKLYKFCILLGHNRELAEDLCQDTYIKAFLSLHQLKKAETIQAWLYQIAKNLYIDQSRRRKNQGHSELGAEPADSKDMELLLQVRKALAKLEPDDRFLLLIVELEGLSYAEAAEMTGKTEDSVRSKLHRLRLEFAKIF